MRLCTNWQFVLHSCHVGATFMLHSCHDKCSTLNEPMLDEPHLNDPQSDGSPATPPASSVYRFLVYGLSIPERTLRGGSAIVAGAVKESATLLVPSSFRSSRSYRTFVDQMLDFMINDVAGVASSDKESAETTDSQVEGYVARKAVSTFVDLAGLATLHVSPLAVLAIVSDMAYGSQTYLRELSAELKREGIIDAKSTIDSTADLLAAVGNTAGRSAEALDTPPLSVEGLRETIDQTRQALSGVNPAGVIPLSEIDRTWREMSAVAATQQVSLFELSSAMTLFAMNRMTTVTRGALSTIRVSGNMFDRHVLDHYREGLSQIGQQGVYAILADSSRPYIQALWKNFASDRPTVTEDLFSGKLLGQTWRGVRGWVGRKKADESSSDQATMQ